MSTNVYVIEDYENETTLRPKKTNPIQTQFKACPDLAVALSVVEGAVEWANFRILTHLLPYQLSYRAVRYISIGARYTIKHLLYPAFRTKNIWLSK